MSGQIAGPTPRHTTAVSAAPTAGMSGDTPTERDQETMADVIKMLEQDHREAEALFAKIKETNGAARGGLVTKLADALKLHMEVEEKIVYPAISKQVTGGTKMVEEAQTEHQGARKVLGDVEKLSPNEPASTARWRCSRQGSPTTSKKRKKRCSRRSASRWTPPSSTSSESRSLLRRMRLSLRS